MDLTPKLGLPYLVAAQAQKHVTHNEALRALDAVVQIGVIDRHLSAPPSAPSEGDCYIVAAAATGAWSTHDQKLAAWQDGAWMFYAPKKGWLSWIGDEARLLVWDGTQWIAAAAANTSSLPMFGINTAPDATNRLAVKSDAVLHSHDDVTPGNGSVQHKLNKAAAANTASFLFQTGYSGRAEFGLTGDDNWHVKVSPDGAVWKEALIVDRTNGWLGIGGHAPAAPVHIVGPGGGVNPVVEANSESTSAIGLDAWRSRGTFAAKTALVDGDAIMANRAYGHDGTSYVTAANLRASVDGAPSAGNVPGKWMFATHTTGVGLTNKLVVRSSGASEPGSDNAYTLGSSSARWSVVYAATGTINTSDARDKDIVSDLAFASAMVDTVEPVLYRWKVGGNEMRASATETMIDDDGMVVPKIDVVASPGRRLHAGFRAQDVKAAMDAAGVEFAAWGLDDKADADSRQHLRPDQLIAVLWAALKETRAELAALRDVVAGAG